MDTIILKFGGSSLANDKNLKNVAEKIIDYYNSNNRVVVVLSAQGKTTDNLLKQAKELEEITKSQNINKRESAGQVIREMESVPYIIKHINIQTPQNKSCYKKTSDFFP